MAATPTDTPAVPGTTSGQAPLLAMNFELRHPPYLGGNGPETYAAALDMISWAEEKGFARISVGEHHQSADGYLPCPLVFAAAVGGRTRRVQMRVSILIAALYDPVRLAEEVAVADLCLQGRLQLGMAAGYVKEDFDAFGADYSNRGRHLEWLVGFLRRAWTGEPFEYRGTTVRVMPRPCQDPMPIYLGGGGSRVSVERAARIADGFLAPAMERPWEDYRAACIRLGRPDPGPWAKRGPAFLWVTTGSKDAAWERLAPYIRNQINTYGAWMQQSPTGPFGPFIPTKDVSSLKQDGAYLVVNPDEAITLARELGPTGELHLNPLLGGIAPDLAWPMLKTFEEEVLPALH
ncbi:LLM class flavin-dependent oxidoreductase [Yinghuangia sp. YIM S09857]|uniref:LLM class flavin-dependent oxidoreductase n=1 Tax=Yinghuangia sp. YIM S09857 TaxID=3436929 RepID=UPI003F531DF9